VLLGKLPESGALDGSTAAEEMVFFNTNLQPVRYGQLLQSGRGMSGVDLSQRTVALEG
jgi:hypothetical protein